MISCNGQWNGGSRSLNTWFSRNLTVYHHVLNKIPECKPHVQTNPNQSICGTSSTRHIVTSSVVYVGLAFSYPTDRHQKFTTKWWPHGTPKPNFEDMFSLARHNPIPSIFLGSHIWGFLNITGCGIFLCRMFGPWPPQKMLPGGPRRTGFFCLWRLEVWILPTFMGICHAVNKPDDVLWWGYDRIWYD